MNLKNKSALIFDHDGFYVALAERLAQDFGEVKYYSKWENSFPSKLSVMYGEGIKGVTRVNKFFENVPDSDIVIFPDMLCSDIAYEVKEMHNKPVWGSFNGEELELDRISLKKHMKKLDLPVNKYEVVKGMKNLIKYLQQNENVFVKLDCFRGDFETMKSTNYANIKSKLDEIEYKMGVVAETVEFICEGMLSNNEYVEVGYDGYNINGEFPTKSTFGIEVKGMGYIGVMADYSKLPTCITDFNSKISKDLKQYEYCNFFSTEVRAKNAKRGYMIDASCRIPNPPGDIYYLYDNYSDIIWQGANGNCIDPITDGKYFCEIIMHSEHANCNIMNVQYPKKYENNVWLKNYCKIDSERYVLPHATPLSQVGVVVGKGKTIDEAIKQVIDAAGSVTGFQLDKPDEALEKAQKEIERLKSFGIDLF